MTSIEGPLPIPVVPEGASVAWSRHDIQNLSQLDADTAYRRAMLFAKGFTSLRTALYAADVMFGDIAGHCEARVPWHQWMLAPRPLEADFTPSDDPLLPDGYELVAEVEILRDVQPIDADEEVLIQNGLREYRRSNPPADWLGDPGHSFARGIRRMNHASGLWLLDIEPRILSREVPPSKW